MNNRTKKVSIIGVGLIGGSIGLALKKKYKNKYEIIGIGRNHNRLLKAKKIKAVDKITTDYIDGVRQSDIVIISTPPETVVPIAKKILPYLKNNCLLTDVSSVKGTMVKTIDDMIISKRLKCHYISSHPIAGSEKNSVLNARYNLFEKTVCILTPSRRTNPQAKNAMNKFWHSLGTKIIEINPEEHDYLLAHTSHLPHVLAASLIHSVIKIDKKYRNLLSDIIGPSFIDLTRIASSKPEIWSQICLINKKSVAESLVKIIDVLTNIKKYLNSDKNNKVYTLFATSKNYRDKLVAYKKEVK